jgi:hypothetical protein
MAVEYHKIELENQASGILCLIANAASVAGEMRTIWESIAATIPIEALSTTSLTFISSIRVDSILVQEYF